jgi:hypothetical protein
MKVKNKYVIHSRIFEAKFRQITLLFSEDLSATCLYLCGENLSFNRFKRANN